MTETQSMQFGVLRAAARATFHNALPLADGGVFVASGKDFLTQRIQDFIRAAAPDAEEHYSLTGYVP
jgi:hypothetical protein